MTLSFKFEINRNTVKAFLSGVILTALAALWVFNNTTHYVQQAKVVWENEGFSIIKFYHDPTSQVLNVRLPIEKFPVQTWRGRAVIHNVTVGIWNHDDELASRMMVDTTFNLMKDRLFDGLPPKQEWVVVTEKPQ